MAPPACLIGCRGDAAGRRRWAQPQLPCQRVAPFRAQMRADPAPHASPPGWVEPLAPLTGQLRSLARPARCWRLVGAVLISRGLRSRCGSEPIGTRHGDGSRRQRDPQGAVAACVARRAEAPSAGPLGSIAAIGRDAVSGPRTQRQPLLPRHRGRVSERLRRSPLPIWQQGSSNNPGSRARRRAAPPSPRTCLGWTATAEARDRAAQTLLARKAPRRPRGIDAMAAHGRGLQKLRRGQAHGHGRGRRADADRIHADRSMKTCP